MKTTALLKCIGLVCAWLFSMKFLGVLFQNTYIIRFLSVLIMGILSFYMSRRAEAVPLSSGEKPKMRIILLSVVSGVGLSFFNMITVVQVMMGGTAAGVTEISAGVTENLVLYSIFSLSGAAVEELFFRGILLNLCKPYYKSAAAIIIPSALFSLTHLYPMMMLHTFISGIVFGYFYYYTRNVCIPVLIHVTVNLMWSTTLNLHIFSPVISLMGEVPGVVFMVVTGLVMAGGSMIVFRRKYVKEKIRKNGAR